MNTKLDPQTYSKTRIDKPFSSYKKAIPAQVEIIVLDPDTRQKVGLILKGNEEDAVISFFSTQDDSFFRRMNKKMLEIGYIIPYELPDNFEEIVVKKLADSSDAELKEILNKKYFALLSIIQDMDTEGVLFRMLNLAREMEKSEKIINLIQAKIAEIQGIDVSNV